MIENYYVFFLLALIAEIIGTISGFGSSILFVPIASLFFDFKSVLGITAVFHVFSNLSKIFLFKNGVNKNIVIKLGIPAIIFVILGAWLSTFLDTKKLELLMNVVLLLMAIYLIFNFTKSLKQSNSNLYLGGAVSGLMAGLVGTGGAIRGMVLAAFNLPKDIFIATSALIDLGVDTSRAIVYINGGYFKKEFIYLIPFLFIISILGSYIGKQILSYTSEKTFRYFVLIIILLTTIFQLLKSLQLF